MCKKPYFYSENNYFDHLVTLALASNALLTPLWTIVEGGGQPPALIMNKKKHT